MAALRCIRSAPEGPSLVRERGVALAEAVAAVTAVGSRVVLASADEVRVVASDGRIVGRFAGSSSASTVAGTSRVLLASSLEVEEIDAASGEHLGRVGALAEDDSDEILAMCSLSASAAVMWTRERGLVLFDVATGAAIGSHLLDDPGFVDARLIAHPDGRRVLGFVVGEARPIVIWDAQDDSSARIDGSDGVHAVAVAPEGRHVAVAGDTALVVVELATGETVCERIDLGRCDAVAWIGEASLVVALAERLLILDVIGDELVFRVEVGERVQGLAVAPDGALVVAGRSSLSWWRPTQGPRCFVSDGSAYSSVVIDRASGEAIASGWGLVPQRWSCEGRFLGAFTGGCGARRGRLRGEIIAAEGPLVHVHRFESVEVIDIRTGSIVGGVHDHGLDGGAAGIRQVCAAGTRLLYGFPPYSSLFVGELFSRGGSELVGSEDLLLADAAFLDAAGAVVVSGHLDGALRIRDVATRAVVRVMITGGSVARVAVGGGEIHVGHADGRVSGWDATSGAMLREWVAHATAIVGLASDRDRGWLATASAGCVRVWDVAGERAPVLLGEAATTVSPLGLVCSDGRALWLEAGVLVMLVEAG